MILIRCVDGASDSLHAFEMQKKNVHPAQELADNERRYPARGPVARNLKALMDSRDWNQSDLARQSGVSQRHISDILRGRTDTTAAWLDKLAAPFERKGFELMVDGLHAEIGASSAQLAAMIQAYVRDPQVRKLLDGAFALVPRNRG